MTSDREPVRCCTPTTCEHRVPIQGGGWACRDLLERGLLKDRPLLGDRVPPKDREP